MRPNLAIRLTKTLSGLTAESKLNLTKEIVMDSTQPVQVRIEAKQILTNLATDST